MTRIGADKIKRYLLNDGHCWPNTAASCEQRNGSLEAVAEGEEPGSNILQVGPAQSSESARRKPHSYG
jgi:hypothetical protein